MRRRLFTTASVPLVAVVLYLAFWPVPVDPVAWQAPPNPGYAGAFAANDRLSGAERLTLGGLHGPEHLAVDQRGNIYASTEEGLIVRMRADGSALERWADTGGRPLGMQFDTDGNLLVADAYRGLLRVTPDRHVSVLADEADGRPIGYANAVAVAPDGLIYLTDSSTKFPAKQWGSTYAASLLDILEHGGHGRLLVHDPRTGRTTTLLRGLEFPNGVAASADRMFVLVCETGSYRVLRHWLDGPRRGRTEALIDALPGFPDNLTTGPGGRFWVALVSPRNALLDRLAAWPSLRRVVQRLPSFLRPAAVSYAHVMALDADGQIVADLQDPDGTYPAVTTALETRDFLYLGSLTAPDIARVPTPPGGWR